MARRQLGAAPSAATDAATKAIVDARGFDLGKLTGLVYIADPRIGTGSSVWSGANRCIYARVLTGGTITKIALDVVTASGNISVAAYSNTGTGLSARPSTRLGTSGAVACPAAGYREVSLGASTVVPDGGWLAMSCDNTTAAFARWGTSGIAGTMDGLLHRQDSAHPAPSPVGTFALTTICPVLIGIP